MFSFFNQVIFRNLLPQFCFLCGHPSDQAICAACLADLPRQRRGCYHCATPLWGSHSKICPRCQTNKPPFTQTRSVFFYHYPVTTLILAAKFGGNFALLHILGDLMATTLPTTIYPDVLIPVPLHRRRYHQRGYNQASILAKRISAMTAIPVAEKACRRIRYTPLAVNRSSSQNQFTGGLSSRDFIPRLAPYCAYR